MQEPSLPHLISLQKIWSAAAYNAFTDLIFYQDAFFCCFRESNEHEGGRAGKIRILTSKDGNIWSPVTLLSDRGVDLRDPKFSLMPDGRLLLSMGGSFYEGKALNGFSTRVSFSENGHEWSPLQAIDLEGEWLWSFAWFQKKGFAAAYRLSQFNDPSLPWILTLFKTDDAIHFDKVKEFNLSNRPSEMALRFTPEGDALALLRRRTDSLIGHAVPPYEDWTWKGLPERLSGPNFIILPNGTMWASAGLIEEVRPKKFTSKVILASISKDGLESKTVFPSTNDCGYPGMVFREDKLYLSYYSSHEGKASIYFAVVAF